MLPDHLIQILVLSALVAAGSGGILIWSAGGASRPKWAELGIGVGFLSGFIALVGGVPFLEDVENPALGEATLGVIAATACLTLLQIRDRAALCGASVVSAACGYWVFAAPDFSVMQNADIINVTVICLTALWLPFRLRRMAARGLPPLIVLTVSTLAFSGLCFFSSAITLTGLGLVLVVALVGTTIWTRPALFGDFGFAALALACSISVGLLAAFLRNTATPPWSLIPLMGCFFADLLVTRLPLSKRWRRNKSLRAFLLGAALVLPAAAAVEMSSILTRLS